MEEILNNTYLSSVIVFITQVLFLYFRTLNVRMVAKENVLGSIITGNMIGITWLVSISIGVKSVTSLELLPLLAFLGGGSLGTYLGFKLKK